MADIRKARVPMAEQIWLIKECRQSVIGYSREIVEQIIPYLQEYPDNFGKGVDTDERADGYRSIVFELCTAYERQSYTEDMKAGAAYHSCPAGDGLYAVSLAAARRGQPGSGVGRIQRKHQSAGSGITCRYVFYRLIIPIRLHALTVQ